MPPTATYGDIKAYQDQVEKDEIKPHGLPPCPVCEAESRFFKIHAYRERTIPDHRGDDRYERLVRADSVQMPRLPQELHLLSGFRPAAKALYPPDDHGIRRNLCGLRAEHL